MNTDDAFGMEETGSNLIGALLPANPNGQNSPVQLWTNLALEQMNVWFELINTLSGCVPENLYRPFFDVLDGASEPITPANNRRVVILSNRPVKVQLRWKDGVPDKDLELIGPFPLAEADSKRKQQKNSEIAISIRYASSQDTQVFDIVVPEHLSNGSYAGIICSIDGNDHGYLSLGLE